MNQLWNVGTMRDVWARWTPAVAENLTWLNSVDCFRPRFFAAPLESAIDIAANGYVVNTFAFVPGSWVFGASQINSDGLNFQLTDTGANYKFFSAPLPAMMLSGGGFGVAFSPPYWFPEPYLMVGPALLRIEIWNNTANATDNSQIVLHVMEPREVV